MLIYLTVAEDWDVPQLVTVHAVDDDVPEGTHYGAIGINIVSFDLDYQQLPLLPIPIEIMVCMNMLCGTMSREEDDFYWINENAWGVAAC